MVLAPIFIMISIWIKFDSKGSVFFRQERVGRYGETFRIHKFRTMKTDSETRGRLTIGDDQRVTQSGKFLRKFKFDVLLGDMSLVGPRPEVQEFIDCYPEGIRNVVLSVRPGITDQASIEMVDENVILGKYRDSRQAYIDVVLPLKQKFYLEYIENQNMLLDLILIYRTLVKIIKR